VIESAKSEKAERDYYGRFIALIDKYVPAGSLNLPQQFDVDARALVAQFAKEQNKMPDMLKELGLNIEATDFAVKLAKHRTALETMRTRTVKIRLNLLYNKSTEEK